MMSSELPRWRLINTIDRKRQVRKQDQRHTVLKQIKPGHTSQTQRETLKKKNPITFTIKKRNKGELQMEKDRIMNTDEATATNQVSVNGLKQRQDKATAIRNISKRNRVTATQTNSIIIKAMDNLLQSLHCQAL